MREKIEGSWFRTRLLLLRGDVTREEVDAIVNAANPDLALGGGVSGAIHRAGGPAVTEAAARIRKERGPLQTGEAVITPGGNLPAKWVIHTVDPVWQGGARGAGAPCPRLPVLPRARPRPRPPLDRVPSISTGAYGLPISLAAPIALRVVLDFLREHPGALEEVRFVLFSQQDLDAYRTAWEKLPKEAGS